MWISAHLGVCSRLTEIFSLALPFTNVIVWLLRFSKAARVELKRALPVLRVSWR
jgi:hypothetical protein